MSCKGHDVQSDRQEVQQIAYAIIRFVLEYLRADAARGSFLFLSTSQWISILIVIAVPAYLIIQGTQAKRVTEGAHH